MKKVIFIDNVNDKIMDIVKDIQLNNDRKIFLFADLLDKKSKLEIILKNHLIAALSLAIQIMK